MIERGGWVGGAPLAARAGLGSNSRAGISPKSHFYWGFSGEYTFADIQRPAILEAMIVGNRVRLLAYRVVSKDRATGERFS